MSLSNYPPGVSDNTIGAPWNEDSVPEKEFDIVCSQTLSKSVTVWTDNYVPGASGCDYEPDGEGGYCACGWHDDDDTSDTNWADEYHENDYHTPLQLIEILGKVLKAAQLQGRYYLSENYTKSLIEECKGWTDDETEYIKEN